MNSWKVILATMVIFGAGVVTGGLLVRHSHRGRPAFPAANQPAFRPGQPGPGGARLEFLRRTQRELELTPEQRKRIDQILEESQERTRKLMEPVSPLLREELQRTKEAFRQELSPEQQARFDRLLKRQQQQQQQQQQPQRPRDPRFNPGPDRRPPDGARPDPVSPRSQCQPPYVGSHNSTV